MSQFNTVAESTHASPNTFSNPFPNALPSHLSAVTANQLLPGWIRRRRKSLDLTQADLARRLACSLSTVQKVEEGERRPSKTLSTNLLDALEIPEAERAVFMRLARGKPAPRNATRDELNGRNATHTEAAAPPNNTPFPTNALIGREAETAWVCDLLAGDDARLVTLTGLPGVGKTRLAQHIAHTVCFEGGVCYVSLADLPSETDSQRACAAITKAIGSALQASALGDAPRFDAENSNQLNQPNQLIAHLRAAHVLLVLDSFEHLLPARDLLIRLLQETRWVKLLMTSCERLRLQTEHVVQLAGLAVGKESSAIQLFVARASRVAGPTFAEKEAAQKMVRICHLVDGLPLGIEMASELTVMHSLDEIGDAIEHDWDSLHTTAPDVPERHRTLRSVLESVWQRLSSEEQRVVAGCAVLPGVFSFEEALSMTQAASPATSAMPLRTTLARLSEKSVVRHTPDANPAQPRRYVLHPLVRRFAQQWSGA